MIIINKVVLTGRLTKDPELKFTPGSGTAVISSTLAVNRRFKKEGQPEADFINIVIWGKQAESVANYQSKGSLLGIVGRLETRSYDAQDGTKRYITEVQVEEVDFLGSKKNNSSQGVPDDYFSGDNFNQVEDDIPF